MNTRLDEQLKIAGDAALGAAGYTPSQAVRLLRLRASRHADDPHAIRALLEDSEEAERTEELRRRKRHSLEHTLAQMEAFLEDAPHQNAPQRISQDASQSVASHGGDGAHEELGRTCDDVFSLTYKELRDREFEEAAEGPWT